jgi:hypothetical protein
MRRAEGFVNAEGFIEWLNEAERLVQSLPDRNEDGNEGTNTHNNADLARIAERLHDHAHEYAPDAAERCTLPGMPKHFSKAEVLANVRAAREEACRLLPRTNRGEAERHSPHPNETTEQPIIDALIAMKAVGLDGLGAIPRHERPTGERLAPKAIGRSCDGQFKATLAHMVDLGWLDNGRNHGIGGGYFLTRAGAALATKSRRRMTQPR